MTDANDVKQRWKEYFEWLLNIDDGRRANGERDISVEDVRKAVKKLKGGELPGVDVITSEMLKCGGECLLEWLRRVCNASILEEKEPNDWMRAIIVPIYNSKGDRSECKIIEE